MKLIHRTICCSLVLSVCFLLLAIGSTQASTYGQELKPDNLNPPSSFSDVDRTYWAFSFIEELSAKKLIEGYPDGKFRPDRIVTRAEFAKMMVLAAGIKAEKTVYSSYSDVQPSDWYSPFIEAAKNYLNGFKQADNTLSYKPDYPALREDMTSALVKLKGYDQTRLPDQSILKAMFLDFDNISTSLRNDVALAVENDLISGYPDETFRPQATITRAEAAAMLWRAFQQGNDNKIPGTQGQGNLPTVGTSVYSATYTPLYDARILIAKDITRIKKDNQDLRISLSPTGEGVRQPDGSYKQTYFFVYGVPKEARAIMGSIGVYDNNTAPFEVRYSIYNEDKSKLYYTGTIRNSESWFDFQANINGTLRVRIEIEAITAKPGLLPVGIRNLRVSSPSFTEDAPVIPKANSHKVSIVLKDTQEKSFYTLVFLRDENGAKFEGRATSDGSIEFLQLADGNYHVEMYFDHYPLKIPTSILVSGKDFKVLSIPIDVPTFSISGKAISGDGSPIARQNVILLQPSGKGFQANWITGEDGSFSISGVAPGRYTIHIGPPTAPLTIFFVTVTDKDVIASH